MLFYYPGDQKWWLGRYDGSRLQWSLAGNTAGFGQVRDGRPIWTSDFSGSGKDEVLFYYPGDQNWWLGRHDGTDIQWALAGNTAGFGQIADGRPLWIGRFTGRAKTEVLFFFPGDANWWLASHDGTELRWSHVGNTLSPALT